MVDSSNGPEIFVTSNLLTSAPPVRYITRILSILVQAATYVFDLSLVAI